MEGLTVVKVGGAALARETFLLERHVPPGEPAVVVHGAGERIGEALAAAGIASRFVGGRRVTPPEAMTHVRAAFLAENRRLCAALGERAVGLAGDEIGLRALRVPALGCVGEPQPFAPTIVRDLLREGRVPVVAPLARGPLNVNADDAAAALALGLGAQRLLFLTDVPGLYVDDEVVDSIAAHRATELLDAGAFEGGIVPKLRAAAIAAAHGVSAEIGRTEVTA